MHDMSKPIPPPPPARRRTVTPHDPNVTVVRTRRAFTADRTSRPGVHRPDVVTDREIHRMQRQNRYGV